MSSRSSSLARRTRGLRARGLQIRAGRFVAALLALLLGAAGPAAADGFTRNLPAEPGGRLLVVLARGTLELAPHESPDGGALRVEVESRGFGAGNVDFELVRRGRDWILVGREADWLRWVAVGPRVTVRAWVPRDFGVELTSPHDSVVSSGALAGRLRPRQAY